jgi:hypothetical protein
MKVEVLVPFNSFTGPVDATHVDAIQVILDSAAPSIDAQLGMIGAFGPVIHDITNIVTSVPEPSFWALISIALALLLCLHRRQQQRL